jgi:hypothetical protein
MAIRVEVAEVQEILGITVDATKIQGFITDASLWVDNYLVGKCAALPADKLPVIEKYIAAHLYTLGNEAATGQLVASTRRGVSERYAERTGSEASLTPYIRIAAFYDPCGIILNIRRPKWRVGTGYQSTTGAP